MAFDPDEYISRREKELGLKPGEPRKRKKPSEEIDTSNFDPDEWLREFDEKKAAREKVDSPLLAAIMGFGKNIPGAVQGAAGLEALFSDKTYAEKRKEYDDIFNRVSKTNPVSDTIGSLAGNILPLALGMGALAPLSAAGPAAGLAAKLGAGAGLASKAGKLAGMTSQMGKGAALNTLMEQIKSLNPSEIPAQLASGGIGEGIGFGLGGLAKLLSKGGKKAIVQSITKFFPRGKEKEAEKMAENILNKKIFGTSKGILSKSQKNISNLESQLDDVVSKNADKFIDKDIVRSEILPVLQDYAQFPATRGTEFRQASKAFENISGEALETVKAALKKKRGLYRLNRPSYDKAPIQLETSPAKRRVELAQASGLRKALEEAVPEMSSIMKEESFNLSLGDLMEKLGAKSVRQNPLFSLADTPGMLAGAVVDPSLTGVSGGLALSKVLRDPMAMINLGQGMNLLGGVLSKAHGSGRLYPATMNIINRKENGSYR